MDRLVSRRSSNPEPVPDAGFGHTVSDLVPRNIAALCEQRPETCADGRRRRGLRATCDAKAH